MNLALFLRRRSSLVLVLVSAQSLQHCSKLINFLGSSGILDVSEGWGFKQFGSCLFFELVILLV